MRNGWGYFGFWQTVDLFDHAKHENYSIVYFYFADLEGIELARLSDPVDVILFRFFVVVILLGLIALFIWYLALNGEQ